MGCCCCCCPFDRNVVFFAGAGAGVVAGVGNDRSGTSTLPSAAWPASSSSRSDVVEGAGDVPAGDAAVGDAPRGESAAPNGFEETETDVEACWEEGAAGVSAAKSELAASEKRSEARFWLLVNLRYGGGVNRLSSARGRKSGGM